MKREYVQKKYVFITHNILYPEIFLKLVFCQTLNPFPFYVILKFDSQSQYINNIEDRYTGYTGIHMNEKFFDLKKEKQDRMIIASLKVFANNGYKHASTDDIVSEAGISKGLLFHYFGSKLGLYTFLHDYSVRFMKLELTTGVPSSVDDYFEIRKLMEFAKMQVLKNYPYMQQFLERCAYENVSEALMAIERQRNIITDIHAVLKNQANRSRFVNEVSFEKMDAMLDYTISGLMNAHFRDDSFHPEMLYEEIVSYLTMMKQIAYKK